MYSEYWSVLLVLPSFLFTGATGQEQRSTLWVQHIQENDIYGYFYQFNVTMMTSSLYDYEFELQYKNLSTDKWTVGDSFSTYSRTSVRSHYWWIRGLQRNTEYAIRVVLKRDDTIIWETSTLIVRTNPPESKRLQNKAYYFSHYGNTIHHKKTFLAAEEFCVDLGGHLASILSSDETALVRNGIEYDRGEYWIGLQFKGQHADYCNSCKLCYLRVEVTNNCELCETCRSEWKWTDRSPMVYQNWELQQPNDNARCAIFNVDQKWYDASCDSSHYFVCAKAISCPRLEAPENGFFSLSSSNFGSVARYSCKTGYRLVGEEYRHCYDFGSSIWLGEAPTCIEDTKGWVQLGVIQMTSAASPTSESTSAATYDKKVAIGLFVAAIVLLLVGGAIMLVFIYRRINVLSEKMTVMEEGKHLKKTNTYQNEGFQGGVTTSFNARNTKEAVTENQEEKDYEELKG